MLNFNTIDPPLYEILSDLSNLPELADFSLVGGTALALQLGHRKSDDLDFFTDHSFDTIKVKSALLRYSSNIQFLTDSLHGMSFTIQLPHQTDDFRKIDIYNWAVNFIRPSVKEGNIRLASLEDIAAFKLDAITHRKEKKDYVDLAVLLEKFTFGEMLGFYSEKFPMNDQRLVMATVLNKENLDFSVEPEMLISLSLEEAFNKIEKKVNQYSDENLMKKNTLEKQRWIKISDLLEKKRQGKSKRKGKSL